MVLLSGECYYFITPSLQESSTPLILLKMSDNYRNKKFGDI